MEASKSQPGIESYTHHPRINKCSQWQIFNYYIFKNWNMPAVIGALCVPFSYSISPPSPKVTTILELVYPSQELCVRAFLVVQWLRICLPMQGTSVQSLVQEDSTCLGATKPVNHSDWGLQALSLSLQQEKPLHWEACKPPWRVAPAHPN